MTNQEMLEKVTKSVLKSVGYDTDPHIVRRAAKRLASELGVKIDERSGEAVIVADGLIRNMRLASTLSAVAVDVSDLATCNVAWIGQGD